MVLMISMYFNLIKVLLFFTFFHIFNWVIIVSEIDISKYMKKINKSNNNGVNEDSKIKKYFIGLGIRILIVAILFLSLSIGCKSNNGLKEKIHDYMYTEDISFTKIKKIYNKYLGGVLPLKETDSTASVFDEKLEYISSSVYYDGAKLTVKDNYLVPVIREGMVVFIGEKENYGNTVIIEDLDGFEIWYGNIANTNLKLYDYVEKGTPLGEVNKELYLVYSKDENFLNYEQCLS